MIQGPLYQIIAYNFVTIFVKNELRKRIRLLQHDMLLVFFQVLTEAKKLGINIIVQIV